MRTPRRAFLFGEAAASRSLGRAAMADDVLMPRINDCMEEGTILSGCGTRRAVAAGDELSQIETGPSRRWLRGEARACCPVVARVGETRPSGVIARLGGDPLPARGLRRKPEERAVAAKGDG